MSEVYKTEYSELELAHNRAGKYEYELGISLYKKKLVLIFSEEELEGLSSFISNFIKREKNDPK